MSRSWHSCIGGKYVLGDRIGEGGMGVVHRAEQPALARTVAIKLLRPEFAADARINARFRAEALAAARLAHPNLVTVIDYGETEDGKPFVVMEYVRGRTLGEIVRDGSELTIERTINLVRQILSGLAAAHAAGVVHADVKSDNVLVERRHDGQEWIKLVDFGLARIGHGGGDRFTGEIVGTPEFMAPEVIAGAEPSPAADLYGVGVILYQLLTGSVPFTGATPTQVMTRHLEDVVVPPSLRRPDRGISPALERVVALALAKSPMERMRDALDFAAALAAAPRPGADFAAVPVAIPRGRDESTQPWRHRSPLVEAPARLAHGSGREPSPSRERDLRHGIADAIAAGAVPAIARSYVDLAALLTERGQLHAAVFELEEAVDLVTAGHGPGAASGATMPLVDALMALYARLNDQRGVYAGAAEHWGTLPEGCPAP